SQGRAVPSPLHSFPTRRSSDLREAERAEELFASSTGSAQRLDSAVSARDAADAALQLAKAQLQSAEIDLDRTTIRAAISGVVGLDRKSARLNSSHVKISYAVFC